MSDREVEVNVLEPARWRSWPLRESPWRSLGVGGGLCALAVVVGMMTGSVLLGGLIALAMAIALWRFFLPVWFEINEQGVEQSLFLRRHRLPWQSIRYFRRCRAGVLLVPRGQRSEMATFHAVYVPWNGCRDRVLLFVEHFLNQRT